MNYLSQRKGFLGYDANQKINHKVIVVPFGLEKTVSYGGGTKNGPKEIIKASHQVELFDEELNKEPYNKSKILLAGKNFGCGSSREHAPWALSDFGIKCIISSSFADIFYNNCFKNGILPIKIGEETVLELSNYSKRQEEIEINLEKQEISFGNKIVKFEIDGFKKKCLINGLDDIGLSMKKVNHIDNYEKKINEDKPWILRNG